MYLYTKTLILSLAAILSISSAVEQEISSSRCRDSSTFEWTYRYGGRSWTQRCSFLSESDRATNDMRRENHCSRPNVRRQCRRSCNNCSNDPPSNTCEDDSSFTWTFDHNGREFTHRCTFLTSNNAATQKRRRNNWCTASSSNPRVRNRCRASCNNCSDNNNDSCVDRPNFRWTDDNGRERSCSFITNATRRNNNCFIENSNGVLVRNRCRAACRNCRSDAEFLGVAHAEE